MQGKKYVKQMQDVQLLPEHVADLVAYTSQKGALSLRAVSRAWLDGICWVTIELRLRVNSAASVTPLRRCLSRLPQLRLLNLRGSTRLKSSDLGEFLKVVPTLTAIDVSFALPLQWQEYETIRCSMPKTHFYDTLSEEPSVDLEPAQVVLVQCYALHARRFDVCYRFMSPTFKSITGPLQRFEDLFMLSSTMASIAACDNFEIDHMQVYSAEQSGREQASAECLVDFAKGACRSLFQWQLCKVDGCWLTEHMLEASWHDLMMFEIPE